MGDQFVVLALAGQGDLASEDLWHRGRLSLENKARDCLVLVLIKKL